MVMKVNSYSYYKHWPIFILDYTLCNDCYIGVTAGFILSTLFLNEKQLKTVGPTNTGTSRCIEALLFSLLYTYLSHLWENSTEVRKSMLNLFTLIFLRV